MAEVYWMDGFQAELQTPAHALATLSAWLEERHIRPNWIEQIHIVTEVPLSWPDLLHDTSLQPSQCGFNQLASQMDEHLLFQLLIRRMRLDESESQILLTLRKDSLSAALLMTHRQVGRYNLRPRLVLAEQLSVLPLDAFARHLPEGAALAENGLYLLGNQPDLVQSLLAGADDLTGLAFGDLSIPACLMQVHEETQRREQLGLFVSRQDQQPLLVTSVRGI